MRSLKIKNPIPVREKNEAGFTLMELLVVIFVSTILLIGLFELYTWHSRMFSYQQALVAVTEQTRNSGETMQILVAQSVQVLPTTTLESVDYVSTSTSVILKLPAIDTNGVSIPATWDTAVFYLDNQNLYQKLRPHALSARLSTDKLLSDAVVEFELNYNDADFELVTEVSLTLRVDKQSHNQTLTSSLEQNMYLKNYY
jgi:prepilin-type N-terminal cleavage/methylation domain-containing protein